jgi:hypothetical protein
MTLLDTYKIGDIFFLYLYAVNTSSKTEEQRLIKTHIKFRIFLTSVVAMTLSLSNIKNYKLNLYYRCKEHYRELIYKHALINFYKY